jgi:hypothetical protein
MDILLLDNFVGGLSVKLDMCMNSCKYCYANYSRTNEVMRGKSETVGSLLNTIQNADHDTMLGYYIKHRYPVCISNTSDVFGVIDQSYSRKIAEALKILGFPLMFETKGCRTQEEINWLIGLTDEKDCIYITMDADNTENLRKIAPKSPSIEDRLKTLDAVYAAGRNIVIAINPYMPEINSMENIISLMKRYPKAGFYVALLHLQKHQHIKGFKEYFYDDPVVDFSPVVKYASENGIYLGGTYINEMLYSPNRLHTFWRKIWDTKKIVLQDTVDLIFDLGRGFTFDEFIEHKKHLMPLDMNINIQEVYSRKAGKYFRHQLRSVSENEKISYIDYIRLLWNNPKQFKFFNFSYRFQMMNVDGTQYYGYIEEE